MRKHTSRTTGMWLLAAAGLTLLGQTALTGCGQEKTESPNEKSAAPARTAEQINNSREPNPRTGK